MYFSILFPFLLLYGLIWLFERKGSEFDGWGVFGAIVIPSFIALFVRAIATASNYENAGSLGIGIMAPITMALCLWKLAELPLKRSILYTLAFWGSLIVFLIVVDLSGFGVIDQPT